MPRQLKVFLCHSSKDKPAIRDLYRILLTETWIDPWLDEEKLLPGQDWHEEIEKAVELTEVVIVFLSNHSVTREGYVQRELKLALDIADEKPENTIFIIPVRLDDCPAPRRLRGWHYIDYFPLSRKKWAYDRLIASLKVRAESLGIKVDSQIEEQKKTELEHSRIIAQEEEARKIAEQKVREKQEKELLKKIEHERKKRTRQDILNKLIDLFRSNIRRFNIGGIILIGILSILFVGSYVFNKLPLATTTPTFPGFTDTPTSLISTSTPLVPTRTPTRPIIFPPDPDIGSTIFSEKSEMVMVYVPAGEFTMGSNTSYSGIEAAHQVYLDAFWIDQTEVTNASYERCVEDGACIPPKKTYADIGSSHYGDSKFDNYPVVNVDWNMAKDYCEWNDARLPTEAEWEKAARGTDERTYPWGEDIDCNKANYTSSCVGDAVAVGSYQEGVSPYQVYDMIGNVSEWVNNWFSWDTITPYTNPKGPAFGERRVIRGGSWASTRNLTSFLVTISSVETALPTHDYGGLGFRCALSP